MNQNATIDAVEQFRDLDRIRDQVLELKPMCRAFSDYLQKRLEFAEAHVLIWNQDTGAIENPNPDRPRSDDVKDFFARHAADGWKKVVREETLLALPLAPRDKLLGLLVLRSFEPVSDERYESAVQAMEVIDSSLEHALAFAQLKLRNRELEAIFALDHLRDEHLPFDQMIDQAAAKIMEYIEADVSAVVLFNEATKSVDVRFPAGLAASEFKAADSQQALQDLAFNAFKMRSLVSAEQIHPQIGSALCVPLILDQDIIGAFVAGRRSITAFDSSARRMLTAMASQIDTAIFEDMQRQRIKGVFTRYVAADVVEEMLNTDRDFLGGRRTELTVLFSDLRGFTAASERLDTDTVVQMLNEHLSAMSEVVLQNRGTLDKFIGDCVMAFWGAPVEQADHALRAVRAAVDMRAAHEKLLDTWRTRGLPPIHIGIGINTGDMFVGNIGDETKSSYTVIGDHVNLASRLEGVARGGEVLITRRTLELVRDQVEFEEMEPVRVKGKSDEIPLFNITALK